MSGHFFTGVDIGLRGCLCTLDASGEYLSHAAMPTAGKAIDPAALWAMLDDLSWQWKPHVFGIEEPIAMPEQSSTATMKVGYGYGLVVMGVVSIGCGYETIAGKRWHQKLCKGIRAAHVKQRSIIRCGRALPTVPLAGLPAYQQEALADAANLADFVRLLKLRGD